MGTESAPLAVITGASSGLGAAVARRLADEGYRLLLVGRRESALREVSGGCGESERYHILSTDIAEESGRATLYSFLDNLQSTHGSPKLLVNCAGLGDYGEFVSAEPDRLAAQMSVNVTATTLITREVASRMVAAGGGVICTVASIAGFSPGPLMAVYYATKAYQLSLSQALDAELLPRGVRSLVVCPGPFRSSFHESAGMDSRRVYRGLPVPEADDVAQSVVRTIRRRRRIVVPGLSFRLFLLLQRVVPRRLVTSLVFRQQRARSTMDR